MPKIASRSSKKNSLKRINIEFDVYFREQSLYETGRVWESLEILNEKGYIYEKDGATMVSNN